ncbi:MAG: ADP-ribosylglycohydrolase family protein [Prolixibacteraceae bacterium]|nr:ADP-ribosylglycohydrolase family protein [Prolixibacteraceae bacterium]
MSLRNNAKDILFGVAVGDALGVPVEFKSRELIKHNPVTDMIGHGTHNQPVGTWSDDSSLTFCLAEAMTYGFDLRTIGNNIIKWYDEGYWSAHGEVFDIGNATFSAIKKLKQGINPEQAGGTSDWDNGNGSLMRILPLVLYTKDLPIEPRFEITKQVSSITHGHIRSVIACFYYLEFARKIINGEDKFKAYQNLKQEFQNFLKTQSVAESEIGLFQRLLNDNIIEYDEDVINSSGYVLHTVESSIWCVLTSNSYSESVLKAVNLGSDTDTSGAVTGGLAGLIYGFDSIPKQWINQLARLDDIADLAERLA